MSKDWNVDKAAAISAQIVTDLAKIGGPCSCAIQLCDHWRAEAGIILTAALVADREQVRRDAFDEAIELVSTEIPVGDKNGPFINSDQIKAVIGHMKKLRDHKEK